MFVNCIVGHIKMQEARMAEYRAFRDSISHLPDAQRQRLLKERREREAEKNRQMTDERRHREMVDAVRSTSFWRFGA